MFRFIVLIAVLALVVCMLAASVAADRLITIPTGRTLTTGQLTLEYAANSDIDDARVYWANVGVSRFEIEGARFDDFGPNSADAFGAQVAIIPETTFTPAVALGVRDISDDTAGLGMPYDGRGFYVAASKGIPVTGGIPILFTDARIHGGIGTGSLSGIFFGAEGRLPFGLRIAAEYDSDDFNYSASYSFLPALRANVSSIKGDIYYGASFSTAF